MFKYKKIALYLISLLLIVFSFLEFIIYLKLDSTIFGLIYMLINLLIIFLIVPITYNYKKYYNFVRISKLILIVILGFFNSYVLGPIIINVINYSDSSIIFMNKIFVIKNILKGLLYFIIGIVTIFEFKKEKIIRKKY